MRRVAVTRGAAWIRAWLAVFALSASALIACGQGTAALAQSARDENAPVIPDDLSDRLMRSQQNSGLQARRNEANIAQAGTIDPAVYILGPGDVLELDLWGRLSRSDELEVSPEGRIFLSGSGPIAVAGHSLAWAQERVLDKVAQTFRGVHAELKLIRLRTFKVYVSGLVTKAGAIEVNSATRASEAIARVGLAEGASRREISVRHRDGSNVLLDLQLFETTGRQNLDPPLLDGDVLHVPRMTRFIEASGAVANPGRFELGANDSLTTLIAMAGGLLPSAERDRALLARFRSPSERESLWLGRPEIESGGSALPLRDGDRLYVFFMPDFHRAPSVEIFGEVVHPGAYPIMLGRDRLSDLLRWAGGFSARADRSAIRLLRSQNDGKEADPEFDRLARLTRQEMTESEYAVFQTKLAERKNSFRVDYNRVQKNGHDIDPLLLAGDLVRVDELIPSVRVEGEVRRPGYVEFEAGRSFGDYVELAGGYTGRAARGKVQVSRSVTGQVLPASSAQSVGPGDFIWVPERHDVDAWQVFRDIVTVGGQIAVIVLAAKK